MPANYIGPVHCEFHEGGNEVAVWMEDEFEPFDKTRLGLIVKGKDGFYRFMPDHFALIPCKALLEIVHEIARKNGAA